MTTVDDLLPGYLGRQRWYSGPPPGAAGVAVTAREVLDNGAGPEWLLVEAGGARYQVVVARRPAEPGPEFLHGRDDAVLGRVDGDVLFDATLDPDAARALLAAVAPDQEARLVRPMGAEQSNTSLVFDDRLVLKLFRRLHDGPNPDVEIPAALAGLGYPSVVEPLGRWQREGRDLAVCTAYLAGGAEGWALALTSLRDLYASGVQDPAAAGGDFAAEAGRLGEVTAGLHVAMAEAFGTSPGDPAAWADSVEAQATLVDDADADAVAVKAFADRLRGVTEPGASLRVHGDYHLGQVMRTDTGWFVLDFEGEPARPLEERRRPSSPLKDVGGMLRSFQYAAAAAMFERTEAERDGLLPVAEAWERRNRMAFLHGYLSIEGVHTLLPAAGADRHAVLAAFELDKAIYELLYERAYRPDWVGIPREAIRRLLCA